MTAPGDSRATANPDGHPRRQRQLLAAVDSATVSRRARTQAWYVRVDRFPGQRPSRTVADNPGRYVVAVVVAVVPRTDRGRDRRVPSGRWSNRARHAGQAGGATAIAGSPSAAR
jgi:hypothetical protein